MGASDFVRPGHVFPLVAKDGGVLMRSGHTEAGVDLCKLAGLPPVAVICELANDDGTVMVGTQIAAFADKHKLKRISVADLIAYRQAREKLVERVACFPVKTPIGELQGYGYRTPFDPVLHFAFVHGTSATGGICRRASIAPTSSATFSAPAPSRRCCTASRRRAVARWSICATDRRACPPTLRARSE